MNETSSVKTGFCDLLKTVVFELKALLTCR